MAVDGGCAGILRRVLASLEEVESKIQELKGLLDSLTRVTVEEVEVGGVRAELVVDRGRGAVKLRAPGSLRLSGEALKYIHKVASEAGGSLYVIEDSTGYEVVVSGLRRTLDVLRVRAAVRYVLSSAGARRAAPGAEA